jgi:hypothetical protein
MKQIFTLVFVLFFAFQTQAQRWFPVGATFTFTQQFWESPTGIKPAEWKVVDTTTINSKVCKKLMMTKGAGYGTDTTNFIMYIYDSSNIVYWFRHELNKFTVLYDFNKAVGETWTIEAIRGLLSWDDTICTLTARVKEKSMDTINGFPLRTMRIEIDDFPGYFNGFEGKIIEFVGHQRRPRPDPHYSCRSISESSDFFGLRCFDHPDIGFHDFKIVPNCDYAFTSINEFNAAQNLNISPNPATDFFDIKYQNTNKAVATIIVSNLMGQQVLSQKIIEGNQKINASNWSAGVYFYQILQEGKIIANGKLMKI